MMAIDKEKSMMTLVLMFLAAYVLIGCLVAFAFGAFMQLSRIRVSEALHADAKNRTEAHDRETRSFPASTAHPVRA
jgi:hypothetical protein